MKIKVRPAIWILSAGLVAALCIVSVGIVNALNSGASGETFAAIVGFGSAIIAVLGTAISKLVESEEVTDK